MSEKLKYKAFLSYSHRDLKWVDWLHGSLERYRVPKHLRQFGAADRSIPRNLRPIFRDRDDLPSGSSLPDVINEALADSEAMIVVCSPDAVASHWVNDEIWAFQKLGRGDRIFCLIVDGEPLSGDARECFPEALRNPVGIDGQPLTSPGEPIAADLRGGRQERHHARMMLIAGLLGVDLDELLQRDHHRRTKLLFAFASVTALIAFTMAGLTIFALMARAEAERRQADAENLVSFMLGDLREDLHAIQRLDLYNSVSQKAMEYFRSLGEEDADDRALALRAEALLQVGESKLDEADMSGALDAFTESLELNAGLVTKNPSREDWNLALAESHFYVGYVHWQRGEFDLAGRKFLEQLSIVDALAVANPSNKERLEGSGFAWTNYGRVLELGGRYAEARQAYENVMEIFQRLLVLEPQDPNSRLEVGFAHNNLGKLKISLGLLTEAEQHFRRDLEMKQQVVNENPKHSLWREHLAGSHYWLARLLHMRSAFEESRNHGEAALEILDELLGIDPTMTPYRQRRAAVFRLLAAACRMTGSLECAANRIDSAMEDLAELLAINPENAQWQRQWSSGTLESAWQAIMIGDMGQAELLVDQALENSRHAVSNADHDWETRKLRALALLTKGDVLRVAGQYDDASKAWQSAVSFLGPTLESTVDPQLMDIHVKLLERLERPAEVRSYVRQLEQMGYRSSYPDIWANTGNGRN